MFYDDILNNNLSLSSHEVQGHSRTMKCWPLWRKHNCTLDPKLDTLKTGTKNSTVVRLCYPRLAAALLIPAQTNCIIAQVIVITVAPLRLWSSQNKAISNSDNHLSHLCAVRCDHKQLSPSWSGWQSYDSFHSATRSALQYHEQFAASADIPRDQGKVRCRSGTERFRWSHGLAFALCTARQRFDHIAIVILLIPSPKSRRRCEACITFTHSQRI